MRSELVERLWIYIREHKLQDTTDKRVTRPKVALHAVFGQDTAHMLMMGLLSPDLRAG